MSSNANRQWGGRFAEGPSAIMEAINASIGFDRKMWRQDIRGSLAHAAMLAHVGIISADDEAAIRRGLTDIAARIEKGDFPFDEALEDIHMNVEARLSAAIGDAGKRLHTGRSRNDQVALDVRLWVRDAIDGLSGQIEDVMRALVSRAEEHAGTVMPGFTHLQPAQPVTLGHHFLAYVEMLSRDLSRLRDCRARMNECPLGAAALAGTGFPIDRHMTAQALGFDRPTLRPADAQQPGQRGVARLRGGVPVRVQHVRDAPVPPRRRNRDLDEPVLRVREAERFLHHRQLDHAAEAQPGCGGARARTWSARWWACSL